MLRYLKYRYRQMTINSVLISLLAIAFSFIVITKLFASGINIAVRPTDIPSTVMSDEVKDVRKLMRLTEKKRFDSDHEYSIVQFSKFQSERQSNIRMFLGGKNYTYFKPEFKPLRLQSPSWFFASETYCHGCFVSYGKRVARLKDVLVDPSFVKFVRGGEVIEQVFNQSEESEYLHIEKGYFYLTTMNEFPHHNDKLIPIDFKMFLNALNVENVQIMADSVAHKTTIVIVRREYANFYHTMVDWYGVFLLMVLFHVDGKHVQVLWLDAHPQSALDATWRKLFGDVQQARSIKEPTIYKDMIWDAIGATNPFNQYKADILPFSEEFRHFFLSQYGLKDTHKINCHNLQIRLIFRHRYIAHPRNPTGYLTRKIRNEKEILRALKTKFTHDDIEGRTLETESMKDQMKMMLNTDILIGMHGAGMTHIIFLPNTSGVIELIPRYFSSTNKQFYALAKWRRLDYMMWSNKDKTLEKKDHFTVIPADLLIDMIQGMRILLCGPLANKTEHTKRLYDEGMFSYDVD